MIPPCREISRLLEGSVSTFGLCCNQLAETVQSALVPPAFQMQKKTVTCDRGEPGIIEGFPWPRN